jgi:hypothetical protein
MSTHKLSNISVSEFRRLLELIGCKYIKTEGGHEKWSRKDLRRPIIFQTHINPVPERIIKSNLRTLEMSRVEFLKLIEKL